MDDLKPVSPDKNEPDVSSDPLNQPYDDKQAETYVTPNGEPTTIAPLPTPLSLQKPKSHAGRWFVRGFVLIIIVALAAFGYWQWAEAQSANNERASLQSELETVKAANKEKMNDADEVEIIPGDNDFEKLAKEAAHFYYCGIADFGCGLDTKAEVRKLIIPGTSVPGFALVRAKTSTKSLDIYVKASDGNNWAVIYSGTKQMDEATQSKFDVPDEIVKAWQ